MATRGAWGIITADEIMAKESVYRWSADAVRRRMAQERAKQRAERELETAIPDLSDPELDFRVALACRDITQVYRLLQRVGVSQRSIALATGQSQSEVSDILCGRRVSSYDLLVRIADGLTVQHGMMGLAYDDQTAELLQPKATGGDAAR